MQLESRYLDALSDAVLLVRDEEVAWGNAAAARLLGREVSGAHLRLDGLLAPGERARLATLETQRAAGWDIPQTCRLRFLRGPGETIATDVRFGYAEDEDGHQVLVLSARDVTEIERAEGLMARFADLSAGAPMASADAVLDRCEPLFAALGWRAAFTEVVEGGSVTRRMLAAPEGDPVGEYGRSLVDRFLPLEETPVLAEVVRTRQGIFLSNVPEVLGTPVKDAVRVSRSLTEARLIRSAWVPIKTAGRVTHHLAVTGRDLTEHDFVAVQLIAAQIGAALRLGQLQAQVAQQARLAGLGQMAAVLAHEVRNPLAVIANTLEALRRKLVTEAPVAPLVETLQAETERLERLVADLLDFARTGQVDLRPTDLARVVRQAVAAARLDPQVGTRRARVDLFLEPELPRLPTDPDLLRRAVVNTVVNALVHVPDDGQVTVSLRGAPPGYRIRIHNDGPAIPEADRDRVFEPFFTTRPGGTGLGLPVVRRLMETLGGEAVLEPSDDGVTLALVLPATPPGR